MADTPSVVAPQATSIPATPANDPKSGITQAAAKEAMKKFKVKIDGQELEVPEDELIRGYGHQKAANKILQEGKAARKQAEEFLEMMRDKGKLKDVLSKLGHNPRELSESILAEYLQDELMDPKDKELRDVKAKLKQIEDMEKQQKQSLEDKRLEEVKTKYMKEYETAFVQALEKSQLPPTKPMVAEMAKYIARSAKLGFQMSADEAAQLVKEDIQMMTQRIIGDSDGEILLKLLGDNVANKIRKYDTSKIKSPEQDLKTPSNQNKEHPRANKRQERLSAKEWAMVKRGLK